MSARTADPGSYPSSPLGERRLPGLHPMALIGLYIVVALIPLVLASAQGLPARNVYRELSSGLVMVGFAMMLVQFLLSGRFNRVSGRVGIDLTMRFHQLVAWAVLAFILLHPFLYAVPRLLESGPGAAMATLNRMFASEGLRTGVIAWWLMVLLVPVAVWRDRLPISYEAWRLSHGLGAFAIAALSVHHTLRVGTYSGDSLLSAFWIGLTGVALASLAHVYLVKPMRKAREPYRVVANDRVAERMWRVAVEPERGPAIDYAGGQFAWLNLGHSPASLTEHPFSISSAPPSRPRIEFTIKESGDFTRRVGEIPLGTRAYVDGPYGNFTMVGRDARPVVLIAGGVGFAPVMGILRELAAARFPFPVRLVYGNRAASQILYADEIEVMKGVLKLDVRLVLSEPPDGWRGIVGQLTPEVLASCLHPPEPEAWHFVCGPTPMMDSVEHTLSRLGIPGFRIISERFKYD